MHIHKVCKFFTINYMNLSCILTKASVFSKQRTLTLVQENLYFHYMPNFYKHSRTLKILPTFPLPPQLLLWFPFRKLCEKQQATKSWAIAKAPASGKKNKQTTNQQHSMQYNMIFKKLLTYPAHRIKTFSDQRFNIIRSILNIYPV